MTTLGTADAARRLDEVLDSLAESHEVVRGEGLQMPVEQCIKEFEW